MLWTKTHSPSALRDLRGTSTTRGWMSRSWLWLRHSHSAARCWTTETRSRAKWDRRVSTGANTRRRSTTWSRSRHSRRTRGSTPKSNWSLTCTSRWSWMLTGQTVWLWQIWTRLYRLRFWKNFLKRKGLSMSRATAKASVRFTEYLTYWTIMHHIYYSILLKGQKVLRMPKLSKST